jgi:hypothetical protein
MTAGAALIYVAPNGKLVLPLPVDYLTWNPDIAIFFDRQELRSANKTLLIGGEASMLAQRKLTERGWSLEMRTPFEGAPAYAQTGDRAPLLP